MWEEGSGCRTGAAPPPPPAAPAPAAATAPATAARRAGSGGGQREEVFARKSVDQLNSERPLTDVFFDLDKADVREDARPTLQKDADWLKRWTSVQVTLEGHADSRGSAEYNLGLGNRRATAVKEYLVSLGVPAGRVVVVSKGKEQPVCREENEACWSQNRRGHFVITGK